MSKGKWTTYNDTIVCSECGFGYFPHGYYFKNHECIANPFRKDGATVFKYCPMCGKEMEASVDSI